MDFFDLVKGRHSVRAFRADAVGQEDLERILQAVRQAPSAGNLQAYEIYLVCDAARKRALANAAGDQEFLEQPPLVLVFCAHAARSAARYGERGVDLYCLQDATIACTFAMLAAAALGLATVWVGAFDEEEARRIIGAPRSHRPVAILPVGYAAEIPEIRSRRSLQELVHTIDA
jgi:nitroreductase